MQLSLGTWFLMRRDEREDGVGGNRKGGIVDFIFISFADKRWIGTYMRVGVERENRQGQVRDRIG